MHTGRIGMKKAIIVVLTLAASTLIANPAQAEPDWVPIVFATGELKEQIDNTHILLRPYRPLHFYGNTVRRLHYRGRAMPNLRDYRNTLAGLLTL